MNILAIDSIHWKSFKLLLQQNRILEVRVVNVKKSFLKFGWLEYELPQSYSNRKDKQSFNPTIILVHFRLAGTKKYVVLIWLFVFSRPVFTTDTTSAIHFGYIFSTILVLSERYTF